MKKYVIEHGGTHINSRYILDFSSNNNPLGVPSFIESFIEKLPKVQLLKHFPDEKKIIDILSQIEGIDREILYPVPGASTGILILMMYIKPEKIYLQNLTYVDYIRIAKHLRINLKFYKSYIANGKIYPDLSFNVEGKYRNVVVIVNPNNPTGTSVSINDILSIVEKCRNGIVIVDTTFEDFIYPRNRDSRKLLDFDNVVIIKSMSKIVGLPGLRVGYIAGKIISEIPRISWPISTIAEFILDRILNFYNVYVRFLKRTAEYVKYEVNRVYANIYKYFKVYKSDIHMLLIESDLDIDKILIERYSIKVRRYCTLSNDKHLFRISIRSREDNDLLIRSLKSISCSV